ncbi:MAG: hypothetical protein IPL78_05710 [Chloroflexi bacterium]|nr:hypothetical protein [Chloroflexota bacterium]
MSYCKFWSRKEKRAAGTVLAYLGTAGESVTEAAAPQSTPVSAPESAPVTTSQSIMGSQAPSTFAK